MKICITGSSGLVGQNLVVRLKDYDNYEIICFDKHDANNKIFKENHPKIKLVECDLSEHGDWVNNFKNVDIVIINHAQISSLDKNEFEKNNVDSTRNIIEVIKEYNVEKVIHVSSSVVNSLASDFYTRSKTLQEEIVLKSGLPSIVLRPTLMFGWFDRKHLGWLSRFLKKTPVFPIPDDGLFMRQPLYVGDFCKVLISCIRKDIPLGQYNISGLEKIYYIDLIKQVRKAVSSKSILIKIPRKIFSIMLKIYALFDKNPPFTTDQLDALVIPEEFEITEWPVIFDVDNTLLVDALKETFNHPKYSKIKLEF